jgi:hypothetical protein
LGTKSHLSPPKCTKSFGGQGEAPDSIWGAYSAPLDPLADFRNRYAAERRGEAQAERRGGRERKGKEEEWRRVPFFLLQMLATL